MTNSNALPLLMRDTEVARELRLSRTSVWALLKSGKLEVIRVGKRATRFTRASVMKVAGLSDDKAA